MVDERRRLSVMWLPHHTGGGGGCAAAVADGKRYTSHALPPLIAVLHPAVVAETVFRLR
jgi:hypothetical protein